MRSWFRKGRSARRRGFNCRMLRAEELERREVLSGDGVAAVVDPGPTLADSVSAPVYGPAYPIQVDQTQRLVPPAMAAAPAPSAPPWIAPIPSIQIAIQRPSLAEGEEPGGGANQQAGPIIDEFFWTAEWQLKNFYFIGHLAYSDPDPFTIQFDTLLEGHSTGVDEFGDFIHMVHDPNGLEGVVGATAHGPGGLQSNRVEVTVI